MHLIPNPASQPGFGIVGIVDLQFAAPLLGNLNQRLDEEGSEPLLMTKMLDDGGVVGVRLESDRSDPCADPKDTKKLIGCLEDALFRWLVK